MFDKIKGLMGIGVEYEEDDFEEEEFEKEKDKHGEKGPKEEPRQFGRRTSGLDNVVSMRGGAQPGSGQSSGVTSNSVRLMVIEPKNLEDCKEYIELLKTRKPVILNLGGIDMDTARRIFDYMWGATEALKGTIESITDEIYVFAPESIAIMTKKGAADAVASDGVKSDNRNMWR